MIYKGNPRTLSKGEKRMPRIGIIGGSGVYELIEESTTRVITTPFGDVGVFIGWVADEEVAFIPRHGKKHSIPPFAVNYRGNLYAFNLLGVERVIATNAVGSLKEDLEPGTIVVPNDFIDMTKGRTYSFYDGKTSLHVRGMEIKGVIHVSMTPSTYCPEIRAALLRAGEKKGLQIKDGGVYVCAEGNRFETPAEIRAFRIMGGDLVGMTGCPEAALARELAICYATLAVVTNYAAGIGGDEKLTHEEVKEIFSSRIEQVKSIILESIPLLPTKRECPCKDALSGAIATA